MVDLGRGGGVGGGEPGGGGVRGEGWGSAGGGKGLRLYPDALRTMSIA